MSRPVWQIAAGTSDRTYSDEFIRYGVALLGPGDIGNWNELSKKPKDTRLRSFVNDPIEGDIIVLRKGIRKISAVGTIASAYQYLQQFDDVMGWDLQHARRVRWKMLEREHEFSSPVFGSNPLSFSATNKEDVIELASTVVASEPSGWRTAVLPRLPELEGDLLEIPPSVQPIVAEILDLYAQFWDKDRYGPIPSEHEMLAHFTIPLVKSLGWKTECIGIEWKHIDAVLFRELPRKPENVSIIVEAKRTDTALESAFDQAKAYADKLMITPDILLTDGIRYRLFDNKCNPIAYANLSRLKTSASRLFEALSATRH